MISNKEPTERDILCFSPSSLNFIYQRPQMLMRRLARRQRVFFFETPQPTGSQPSANIHRDECGIYRVTSHLPMESAVTPAWSTVYENLIFKTIARFAIRDYELWIYDPLAWTAARELKPRTIVYDCTGETDQQMGPQLAVELNLLDHARLVFTPGPGLYRSLRALHPDVYLMPNGVDRQLFQAARRGLVEPEDQVGILRPRLGIASPLDGRIDWDLLAELAWRRPDWQLVFLGPTDESVRDRLPVGENIHFLGPKPYGQIPAYLAGWDAVLLPFAAHPNLERINPPEIMQYLVAGVPVISSPMKDVEGTYGQRKVVRFAASLNELIAAVETVLNWTRKNRQTWLSWVDPLLYMQSWDHILARMQKLISFNTVPVSG